MKICSVCSCEHNNDELRCKDCADKNLRPSDKYREEKEKDDGLTWRERKERELKGRYSDIINFPDPLDDLTDSYPSY